VCVFDASGFVSITIVYYLGVSSPLYHYLLAHFILIVTRRLQRLMGYPRLSRALVLPKSQCEFERRIYPSFPVSAVDRCEISGLGPWLRSFFESLNTLLNPSWTIPLKWIHIGNLKTCYNISSIRGIFAFYVPQHFLTNSIGIF